MPLCRISGNPDVLEISISLTRCHDFADHWLSFVIRITTVMMVANQFLIENALGSVPWRNVLGVSYLGIKLCKFSWCKDDIDVGYLSILSKSMSNDN